jgi:hypothetical protein
VHPGAWTLRQLLWAAHGKQKESWNHTAALIAQQYSIHRDPKKRREPYKPKEFHPYTEKPKPKLLTPQVLDKLFGET